MVLTESNAFPFRISHYINAPCWSRIWENTYRNSRPLDNGGHSVEHASWILNLNPLLFFSIDNPNPRHQSLSPSLFATCWFLLMGDSLAAAAAELYDDDDDVEEFLRVGLLIFFCWILLGFGEFWEWFLNLANAGGGWGREVYGGLRSNTEWESIVSSWQIRGG